MKKKLFKKCMAAFLVVALVVGNFAYPFNSASAGEKKAKKQIVTDGFLLEKRG